MQKLQKILRLSSLSIAALCIGFILGDEFMARLEKREIREACYESNAAQLQQAPNHDQDLLIRFRCRSMLP